MKRLRVCILLAPFALWAGMASGTTVCGAGITPYTAAQARQYEIGAKPPRPDFSSLEALLVRDASKWPEDVARNISWALAALKGHRVGDKVFEMQKRGAFGGEQSAFSGTGHEVVFPVTDTGSCQTNPLALRDAARYVLLVYKVVADSRQYEFSLTATQIAVLEKQYDQYLFDGFPMFPWEAAVNGLFLTKETIAHGPPRNMLVLLHPAAGVVGAVGSGSKSDIGGALSIEPIGWIHYSADYSHWYGASLLTVFPTDRNVGYGIAFNYQHYKLGVVWVSGRSGGHGGATIFLGMDLLQFVSKEKRAYSGYLEKVKQLLGKAG